MSTDTSRPAERATPPRVSFAGHLILACFIATMLASTLHKTVFSTLPMNVDAAPVRVGSGNEPPAPAATAPGTGAAGRHAQSRAKRPVPPMPVRRPA